MLVLPRTELTLLILIIAHEVQVFGVAHGRQHVCSRPSTYRLTAVNSAADGRGQSENIIERLKKAIFKI